MGIAPRFFISFLTSRSSLLFLLYYRHMDTFSNEPLYRPALKQAFAFSWRAKYLWPIAVLAGFLLSGSLYDVIWSKLNAIGAQASIASVLAPFWSQAVSNWPKLSTGQLIFGSLNVLILTCFFLIIGFALYAASVISQGAIVYAAGTKTDKKRPLGAAITVGARALWPIFVLNVIITAVMLALRSLTALVLAFVSNGVGPLAFVAYMIAFVVFVVAAIAAVIVQIFALNAMILQGATLAQGLERGMILLQRHWVIAAETGAILFLISVAAYIAIVILGLLLTIPYVILLLVSAALKSGVVFACVTLVFILIFLLIAAAVFGFLTLVHYATWTALFRRFGEGGALPKLHRLVRAYTHSTHVPGA
jgi:hypothetical protein